MPQGVTEVSQAAYDIHMIMMWICTVIGIAVFGFMFYVMYAHRKSRGAVAANFHENHVVELILDHCSRTDFDRYGDPSNHCPAKSV